MEKADYWSVARTLAQREAFASERLKEQGFEVFLPLLSPKGGKGATTPMFINYLFVRIVDGRWRAVDRTFGVMKLVRFGDAPGRVPDREIDGLRARADANGVIRLPPPPSGARRVYAKGEKSAVA